MQQLEIVSRSIDDLKFDPENARKHEDQDISAIALSLQQFGQQSPIVITADGVVVKGNGTLMAAMKLGWTEIACVETQLTGDQLRAYAIADNKTALLSDWNWDRLAEQLAALEGELLAATAFSQGELEEILARLDTGPGLDEVEEDEAPDLPAEAVSRVGQLWRLGEHVLAIGDCLDASLVDRAFEAAGAVQCDLVFTDPPYNVDLDTEASKGRKSKNRPIAGDKQSADEFRAWLLEVFRSIEPRMRPGAPYYCCHADLAGLVFREVVNSIGLPSRQCLIWVKNSLVVGRQDYHARHEPILYGWKGGKKHKWYGGRNKTTVVDDGQGLRVESLPLEEGKEPLYRLTFSYGGRAVVLNVPWYETVSEGEGLDTIWRIDRPTRSAVHPTMKPVLLVSRAIENSSRPGELVYDPFAGSGTIFSACEQMQRRAVGIEIDPRYADVIIARWEALSGKKAVLISESGEG